MKQKVTENIAIGRDECDIIDVYCSARCSKV